MIQQYSNSIPDRDGWCKLGSLPVGSYFEKPVVTSPHTFSVTHKNFSGDSSTPPFAGVLTYNIKDKCWRFAVPYDGNTFAQLGWHSSVFNSVDSKLFMYACSVNTFVSIDLTTGRHMKHVHTTESDNKTVITPETNSRLQFLMPPQMIFIDGYVHCVGRVSGQNCYQHVTWHFETNKFRVVHTFQKSGRMYGDAFIYLRRSNRLMLLGSSTGDRYFSTIYTFDLNAFDAQAEDIAQFDGKCENHVYTSTSAGNDVAIGALSIETAFLRLMGDFDTYAENLEIGSKPNTNVLDSVGWIESKDLKMPKELWGFSCVVTKDEKYLLLLFGEDNVQLYSRHIYILNLRQSKWYRSRVTVPPGVDEYLDPYAILMDEADTVDMNLLIDGIVRRLSLERHVPTDVVSIVAGMYVKEMLHVLQRAVQVENSNHFQISLELVLGHLI